MKKPEIAEVLLLVLVILALGVLVLFGLYLGPAHPYERAKREF